MTAWETNDNLEREEGDVCVWVSLQSPIFIIPRPTKPGEDKHGKGTWHITHNVFVKAREIKRPSEEKTKPETLGKDFWQIRFLTTTSCIGWHFTSSLFVDIIDYNANTWTWGLIPIPFTLCKWYRVDANHQLCPEHPYKVPFYSNISYCSPSITDSFHTIRQLGIPNTALVKILTELPLSKLAWLTLHRW